MQRYLSQGEAGEVNTVVRPPHAAPMALR